MGNPSADASHAPMATSVDCAGETQAVEEQLLGLGGQWLGDFTTTVDRPYGLSHPMGWTSGGWYGVAPECKREKDGCECDDCYGAHVARFVGSRVPGEDVRCRDKGSGTDFWERRVEGVDDCMCGKLPKCP